MNGSRPPDGVIRIRCDPTRHNYQPRYDEITNVNATSSAHFWSTFGRPAQRIVDKIWIADVCSLCGDMIARPRSLK